MLEISDATVMRGRACVLQAVTLRLQPGMLYAVIGPNGAGKSTLLRMLSGQLPLAGGRVRHDESRIGGRGSAQWRADTAYMPQDIGLDVELTAVEVVLLGRLTNLGVHVDDSLLHGALAALDTVGLLHAANRSVSEMSGGQRQMVLFAQLLMRQAPVMLLDEPVSALDLKHQVRLLDVLHEQTRARRCTTLVVLHDLNLVAQYADEVVVIGGGKLLAQGEPCEVMTAEFIELTYGVAADVTPGCDGMPRITALRGTPRGT